MSNDSFYGRCPVCGYGPAASSFSCPNCSSKPKPKRVYDTCHVCNGRGEFKNRHGNWIECIACDGEGKYWQYVTKTEACAICNGKGEFLGKNNNWIECLACDGRGTNTSYEYD